MESSSYEEINIEIEMEEEKKMLRRFIVEDRTQREEVAEHDIDLDFDHNNEVEPPQQPFSGKILFPTEGSDEDPDW